MFPFHSGMTQIMDHIPPQQINVKPEYICLCLNYEIRKVTFETLWTSFHNKTGHLNM